MSADPPNSTAEAKPIGKSNGREVSHLHFRTLDLSEVKAALETICEAVIDGHGRIEITACDHDHRCVIISKQELDDLERALAILAGTQSALTATERLRRLAAAANDGHADAASNRFAEAN